MPPSSSVGSAEHLLPLAWVVDDSPMEVEAIRRAVASACRIEVFSTGEELLEALQHRPSPDVLVLDWHLPGMSGIEVCRYLRGTPATAMLPILLVTGHTRPEDVEEGLLAGANDYVFKPFHAAELLARVHALLRWELQRKQTLADERALRIIAERALLDVQAAEERARHNELRYKLAARATRDVIWEWNPVTGELQYSPSFQTYFGYAPENVGSTLDRWWERSRTSPSAGG